MRPGHEGGMTHRLGAFAAVGAAGFGVQLAVVAALTSLLGWPPAVSTAVGVEAAVLHNFFWHERWTWRDRPAADGRRLRRLARFHAATGVTSVAGNVAIVALAVGFLGIGAVIANALAVAVMSAANYLVADRFVFRRRAAFAVIALCLAPVSAHAAELTPQTLEAWRQHVAATEASLAAALDSEGPSEPTGRETRIPGGIVHDWRGSVFIPDITVKRLVDALTNPGLPPPQEDVIESRVLARNGDTLRVYLKLVRTAIITVTYDTEHDVTFVRRGPQLATSRSVATRITEAGGEDHGFLWRLNSYWRYRQRGAGVQVDVGSLSLSRGVPAVLRPFVGGLVNRIARESMTRTLDAVRRFGRERSAAIAPGS
jgi:putative flippase GtrA